MSRSKWPTEPFTAPGFQNWHNQPDEDYGPRRGRVDEPLSQRREMDHVRSDSVRGGWSSEPRGSKMRDMPAQTSSATLDMSFLDWLPRGDVTVSYHNARGGVQCVHGINQGVIEDRSSLLWQAFEGNRLHLEAVGADTIRPLMQYLYTGAYSLPTPSGEAFEDVPTSLLIHCQMYHLADIYDMGDLKSFANVAIILQCEFGCSSPDQPIDLCPAIKYVYNNMREHEGVIETIIAYCVTCFLTHALSDDFELRKLAFDLRPFHQDLCKISMERRFDDDGIAQAIIQMPFRPYVPATYASREDRRATQIFEDVYHFHGDNEGSTMKQRQIPEQSAAMALALRPKSRKVRTYDFTRQGKEMLDADDETAAKVGYLESSSENTTQPLREQQKRWQDLCETNTFGSRMQDETLSWADEDSFASDPGFFPGKGKLPLRVVNYTAAERVEAMGMGADLRPKKHVTFGDLAEKMASPAKPAAKEPKAKVSRELFNNLVSAGLTGKPGLSQQATEQRSLQYLKARGFSQEVHKICAELAKEELEKARLEAEHKAKIKNQTVTHDRQAPPPPPPLKAANARDETQLWRIPPPTLDQQVNAAMPDGKMAQFMKGSRKADQDAREEFRLRMQSQQRLADEKNAVLDADFEVVSGPPLVEELGSESESDSDLVKIDYSPSMSAQETQSLRVCNLDIKEPSEAGPDVGPASDSDWDMI